MSDKNFLKFNVDLYILNGVSKLVVATSSISN